MNATLEALYTADQEIQANASAYAAARKAKVAEIAALIGSFLENPDWAEMLARDVMNSAEDMGRFDGDHVNGEVSGYYTLTGNPLPFTV